MTDDAWLAADAAVLLCGGNPRAVRQRANAHGISPELVEHACQRSLETLVESGDALLPFRRWEETPPGCLDVRVFDQVEYWIDALRIPHLIRDRQDMTDDDLAGLIEFLINHADHLLSGYRRYQPIEDNEPRQWIESTVLMRGLRDELRTRAL